MFYEKRSTLKDLEDPQDGIFSGIASVDRARLITILRGTIITSDIYSDQAIFSCHSDKRTRRFGVEWYDASNLLSGVIDNDGRVIEIEIELAEQDHLSVVFSGFEKLQSLELSSCDFSSLPGSMYLPPNLKTIKFCWNRFPNIRDNLDLFSSEGIFLDKDLQIEWEIGCRYYEPGQMEDLLFNVLPRCQKVTSLSFDDSFEYYIWSFECCHQRLDAMDASALSHFSKLSLRFWDIQSYLVRDFVSHPSVDHESLNIPDEIAAFCAILRAFSTIERICSKWSDIAYFHPNIQYELVVNWAGRKLIECRKSTSPLLPLSMWPTVLARKHPVDEERKLRMLTKKARLSYEDCDKTNFSASAVYYLLRNGPVLRGGAY